MLDCGCRFADCGLRIADFEKLIAPFELFDYIMENRERPFEQKKCPRCGSAFVCSTSAKCWCFEIEVPPAAMEIIQETWDGCLCPTCLKSFSETL
jgi:hypothetical protein